MLSPDRETGRHEELRDAGRTHQGTPGCWEWGRGALGSSWDAGLAHARGAPGWRRRAPEQREGLEPEECLGGGKGGQGAPEQRAECRKREGAWYLVAVSSGRGASGWAQAAYSVGRQMMKEDKGLLYRLLSGQIRAK